MIIPTVLVVFLIPIIIVLFSEYQAMKNLNLCILYKNFDERFDFEFCYTFQTLKLFFHFFVEFDFKFFVYYR